jgi:hypothetical protein
MLIGHGTLEEVHVLIGLENLNPCTTRIWVGTTHHMQYGSNAKIAMPEIEPKNQPTP